MFISYYFVFVNIFFIYGKCKFIISLIDVDETSTENLSLIDTFSFLFASTSTQV